MERKGQAAMEFLMTYGWAILAAIIAIGVLGYFGVFSPDTFATGSLVVNAPFYGNGYAISAASGNVTLELKNQGGEEVLITNVSVNSKSTGVTCTSSSYNVTSTASSLTAIGVPCTGANFASGKTFKGDITVTYTKSGSSLSTPVTGSLAGKISA